MRPYIPAALALACLLIAGSGQAADKHKDVSFSPAKFPEQRGNLIEALNTKVYAELSDEAKREVLQALDRMQKRLEGIDSVSQLSKTDKIEVFNDQELINTLLTSAAADSRLICRREKTLGSNMRGNSCLTVAERRRRQQESQDQVRQLQRSAPLPAGN